MISLAHAPNATPEQQALCRDLLKPWRMRSWRTGQAVEELETWFKQTYGAADAVGFSTGREALYAVVQALGLGQGDEVIIQAYTCIVVPHALVWNGVKPVYVDIDTSLNIDPKQLEKAITPATKAILVQHTFGMPADMDAIVAICKKHQLFLIEDLAHAFGAQYRGQPVGQFGDVAIFSFGRDKAVSSTAGGMAIAKSAHHAERLREMAHQAPFPSLITIKQNILHPLIVPFCLKFMDKGRLGGALLRLAQYARLINRVYAPQERESQPPNVAMRRLPNAMALMALQQIRLHHQDFLKHRQLCAQAYTSWATKHGLTIQQTPAHALSSWLRFTVFIDNPQRARDVLRKDGYILGDWYASVIMPKPYDISTLGYTLGSCPQAEQAAKTSLNLPTHRGMPVSKIQELTQTLSTLL